MLSSSIFTQRISSFLLGTAARHLSSLVDGAAIAAVVA
jgi:hypothetical protein